MRLGLCQAGLCLLVVSFVVQIGCTKSSSEPTTVMVVSPPPKGDALVALGKKLYASKVCSTCHSMDGSPAVGPTFQGLFGKMVELKSGDKVLANEAYIRESILDPNAKISKGFPAVMPKPNLKDEELDALVAFIKSLGEVEKATQK